MNTDSSNDPFAGSGFEKKPDAQSAPTPQTQEPQPTPRPVNPAPVPSSDPFAGSGFEDTKKLSDIHREVMNSDASKNAQVLNLSTQSGMTPQQVSKAPEDVQKAVDAPTPQYLDGLHGTAPMTARWLTKKENMAATHDQIPELAKTESIFQDYKKGLDETMASHLMFGGWPMKPDPISREAVSGLEYEAAKIASPNLNADALNEYTYHGNMKPLVAQIAHAIPSWGAMILKGPFAGLETAGQTEQRILNAQGNDPQKITDPEAATKGALITGGVGAAVGMIPFHLLGKVAEPLGEQVGQLAAKQILKQALADYAVTTGSFVAGGQANLFAQTAVEKIYGENPKAFDDYVQKMKDQGIVDFATGAVMGGVHFGSVVLFKGGAKFGEQSKPWTAEAPPDKGPEALEAYRQEVRQQLDERGAKNAKEGFLKAVDAVKEVKLSKDNPGMMKDFIKQVSEGGMTTAHIPVEQFQELYQEKADEMAEKLGPEFKASYDQAKDTGGTVSGPLSDLLTSKEDIKPTELSDHIKFDPIAKTVTEATEGKKVAEQAKTELEAKAKSDEEHLADFHKMIKEGAENIGGEVAKGAETQAKGITKVLKSMSEILKKSPAEIIQLAKFSIMKGRPTEENKFNPFGMHPEDEKGIFGNVVKEPNQELFQSSGDWDKLNKGWKELKFKAQEQEIMGMKPAVQHPVTKQIWSGYEHSDALKDAQNDGAKVGYDDVGFLKADGTFINRHEAEKEYGFKDSYDLLHKQELFQSGNEGHRGGIIISGLAGEPQGRSFQAYAEANSDKSTLFHEFAHAFLQIFRDHVAQDDATPEAKEIETKILKWFDVKGWDEVGDRHSEMFARGFEYRLWEGKSPSGLEQVFAKFAEWMRKIYPSSDVMAQYLKSQGGEMTDEMRGVYDRFISSSEEISKAEKEMGYSKDAPEGLSKTELQEWTEKQDKATQRSMGELASRKMADLSGESQRTIAQEKIDAEKNATEEVNALPVFQSEKELEGLVKGTEGKWKHEAEKYLAGTIDDISKGAIDHIALKNGYENGGALAYGLVHADKEESIKSRVEAHMDEFTPKVQGSEEDAIKATIDNEERADAIAYVGAVYKHLLDESKQDKSAEEKIIEDYKDRQKEIKEKRESKKNEPGKLNKKAEGLTEQATELNKKSEELLGEVNKAKLEMTSEGISDLLKRTDSLLGEVERIKDKELKGALTNLKDMLDQVQNIRKETAIQNNKIKRENQIKAKADAYNLMSSMKLAEAQNVGIHMTNMRDAALKAKQFAKDEEWDKAREWNQKQLLNRELALQAARNRTIVRKTMKDLQDKGKIDKKPLAMPFGHWNQMKAILENAKMKEPKPLQDYSFSRMAQEMQRQNKEPEEIANATGFVFDEQGKPVRETMPQFKERISSEGPIENRDESLGARINVPENVKFGDMTLGDLRNVANSINAIYKHGLDENQVEIGGKKLSVAVEANRFKETIEKNVGTKHADEHPQDSRPQKILNAMRNLGDFLIPDIVHIETLAELIDGATVNSKTGNIEGGKEGVAHDLLTNPLRDAQTKERTLIRETVEKQKALHDKFYPTNEAKEELEKPVPVKTSKGVKEFTRNEARNLTAITGSREGMDRLTRGNGYTDTDIMAIKDILKKEDVDYLRERAKLDEEKFPQTQEMELRLHNREVKECQKIAIETKHGEIPGMYHPIKYDFSHGRTLLESITGKEEADIKKSSEFTPLSYADAGFTKSRARSVARPVRLDEGVYKQYLADTDHYLSHQPALINVNKALRNPTIQKALVDAFGARGSSLFAIQTKYLANGAPPATGFLEKAFQYSRISDILYNIGMRPQLFIIKRVTDVINVANEVGGLKNYIQMQDGSGPTIFSDKFKAIQAEVDSKSPQMRDRGENFDYNVRAVHKAFQTKEGALAFYRENAYLPEKLADRRVAYLSWKYMEGKLLAEGKSDEVARRQADMFVEQVLGAGSPLQHIGVMRGNEYLRSFSPAFTFFSAQYQRMLLRNRVSQQMREAGNPLIANKIIVGSVLRFIVAPTLIGLTVNEAVKHHKEDYENIKNGRGGKLAEAVGERATEETFNQTVGMLPGGRNIANAIEYHRHGESTSFFPIGQIAGKVADSMWDIYKHKTNPSKNPMGEKQAQDIVDSATMLSKAPHFLENEMFNLYEDVIKNGHKDAGTMLKNIGEGGLDYLFGQRHKQTGKNKANPALAH